MILLISLTKLCFQVKCLIMYNLTCCMQNQGRELDERLWSVYTSFYFDLFSVIDKSNFINNSITKGVQHKYKKKLDILPVLYNSRLKHVQKLSCAEYRISPMPRLCKHLYLT